jgi:hypothetical protein
MKTKKRVELVESALARKNGDFGFTVVVRMDGETDDQARERNGLTDKSGQIVFLSEDEAKL